MFLVGRILIDLIHTRCVAAYLKAYVHTSEYNVEYGGYSLWSGIQGRQMRH